MSLPAPVFATSWCSAGDDTIYLTAPNPTFDLSPIQFTCTIRTFFIVFLMQFFLHRHVPYNSSRLLDPFAPFFPTWTVSAAFLCVCFDFASASSNLPQESVQHSFLTSLPPRCNLPSIRPLSTQWLELFPRLHFPSVSPKKYIHLWTLSSSVFGPTVLHSVIPWPQSDPWGAHQRPR